MGIAGLPVRSVQSCWVAFMVFVSMLWHWRALWHQCNSAMFVRCASSTLQKALSWVRTASHRNKSNVYASPLACAAIMAFLIILRHIVFTGVLPPCNMNSREGGLGGGANNLGMSGWYRTIMIGCGSNVVTTFDHQKGWGWLRCGCHLLHNVVMGTLQIIKNTSHSGKHTPVGRIQYAFDR